MKADNNFIVMDREEFRPWLKKQTVTREVTRLQVHHTWSPSYKDFKDGQEFQRLNAMRNYHLGQGWNDIGQNITSFPNGKIGISIGRGLNVTPAGIKGANIGALCIENLGNFDRDGDTMTAEHKATIVHLYACLAEKYNLPIDTSHIVYHAWYTREGDRLSDYIPGKSSKTCPGIKFWGDGNTVAAAVKGFLPDVKAELDRILGKAPNIAQDKPQEVRVYYNGNEKDGYTFNNRTYVGVKELGDFLGFTVGFNNTTKKAIVNGKELQETEIIGNQAYVQAVPLAKAFADKVTWIEETKKLFVKKEK